MKIFGRMFYDSFKSLKDLRTLTTTGILIALAFAIRSFSIEVTPDLRIGFTFLATCTIGMLYGPVVCGMSTFVLDFLGYIVQNKSPSLQPTACNGSYYFRYHLRLSVV